MKMNDKTIITLSSAAVLLTGLFLLVRQSWKVESNIDGEKKASKRFHLYSNPHCPFAHRVWIVIAEFEAQSLFSFVPIPLRSDLLRAKFLRELPPWAAGVGIDNFDAMQRLKEWYIESINTAGEVPSLTDSEAKNPDKAFKESDVVAEYVAILLDSQREEKLALFPTASFSPEDTVQFRLALKTFPVGSFYALLRNQDPDKDEGLLQKLLKELLIFSSEMSDEGPFYLGPKFTFADIFAIGHMVRFVPLLKHYRGVDLLHPSKDFNFGRLRTWFLACSNRPSVRRTTPPINDVFKFYEGEAHENHIDERGFHGRGVSTLSH